MTFQSAMKKIILDPANLVAYRPCHAGVYQYIPMPDTNDTDPVYRLVYVTQRMGFRPALEHLTHLDTHVANDWKVRSAA